jgi:hypothetical protein
MSAPPSMTTLRSLAFETRDSIEALLGPERSEERRLIGASRPLAETVQRTRNALLGRPIEG